jgi:hypothetical protein
MKSHAAIFSLPTGKPRENFLDSAGKSCKINSLRSVSPSMAGKFLSLPRVLAGNSEVGATPPTARHVSDTFLYGRGAGRRNFEASEQAKSNAQVDALSWF